MTSNGLLRPLETIAECKNRALQLDTVQARLLAWENLISQIGSNGHMITLGFRTYLDKPRSIEVANHFLVRVNRRIFGKRFRRICNFLSGIVILEHKHRSSRSSNSPHFHFVVSAASLDKSGADEGKLRSIVAREAGRLCFPTLDPLHSLGGPVSGTDFVDVTRITAPTGLANYLTKECWSVDPTLTASNIGFFGVHGIVGL